MFADILRKVNEMDSKTQLLIRACKSGDPDKRLKSIYRRLYLMDMRYVDDNVCDYVVCENLLKIITEFIPHKIDVLKILSEFAPDSYYMVGYKDKPHWYRVKRLLISYLRFSNTEDLIGYKSPLKFRN